MKKSIAFLYRLGKIGKDGVKKAVEKGFITQEDYIEITGEAY